MSVKLHIKKGDMVYVNAGDSKGQQGKVLKVDAQKQRAIVEGGKPTRIGRKQNAAGKLVRFAKKSGEEIK